VLRNGSARQSFESFGSHFSFNLVRARIALIGIVSQGSLRWRVIDLTREAACLFGFFAKM
jgi:hypothetical protein